MSPARLAAAALTVATTVLTGCADPPASFAAVETTATPAAAAAVAAPKPAPRANACDAGGAPTKPATYDPHAIAAAMTWVYRDQLIENYCNCAFGPDQVVDPTSCGYAGTEPLPQVRWEPVVPPSRFGVYRHCWKQFAAIDDASGDGAQDARAAKDAKAADQELARKQCAAVDDEFRAMEADLYNYHPVLAKLSAERGENFFGPVQGEPREHGACDFEVQSVMGKAAKIEPPADVRGDIARIYLYMAGKWGKGKDWKIKLSLEQRQMLEKWSEADPVDAIERQRACRIAAIQGWENPYVK